MTKVKITTDRCKVFKADAEIDVMDFMRMYFDEMEDKTLVSWLQRIPIPSAVDYIAQKWGLTYKYI